MKYLLLLLVALVPFSAFAKYDCQTLKYFADNLYEEEDKKIVVLTSFYNEEAIKMTAVMGAPNYENIYEFVILNIYDKNDHVFIGGVFDKDGCNIGYGLFNEQGQQIISRLYNESFLK